MQLGHIVPPTNKHVTDTKFLQYTIDSKTYLKRQDCNMPEPHCDLSNQGMYLQLHFSTDINRTK